MEGQAAAWQLPATDEEMADIKKSYQWLEKAGLKDSTETLILVAQGQAIRTRS